MPIILFLLIVVALPSASFAQDACVLGLENQNVAWLPKPNTTQWFLARELPPGAIVSAAYVLAFQGDEMLWAEHRDRGWGLVGGHIDPGETPEAAAIREAWEETGATITNLRLLGYQKLMISGPKPDGYTYPYPESYQALYIADIADLGEFKEEEDTIARALHSVAKSNEHIAWAASHMVLVEAAATFIRSR